MEYELGTPAVSFRCGHHNIVQNTVASIIPTACHTLPAILLLEQYQPLTFQNPLWLSSALLIAESLGKLRKAGHLRRQQGLAKLGRGVQADIVSAVETNSRVILGLYWVILGLYWVILKLYWDNGKENGNYYLRFI